MVAMLTTLVDVCCLKSAAQGEKSFFDVTKVHRN